MVSRSNSSRFVLVLAWLVAMGAPLAPLGARAPAPTAPPPPPLRLSFADAVRLASGEVPVVALATLRTTEADARVRQARAALLPSLSLGGAWVNRDFNSKSLGIPFPPQFNLPNPVPPFDNYDGRVTVTQTLFDWSSVARVRAAGAQADGSRAERGVTVEGAALAAALAGRPDLGAELARGAAARRSGTAIRAERLPRVGVEADYGVNGLTGPSALSTRQVALQVTLPILDGFRREARAAEQDAVVRESQVRESDLRWQIAAEVDAALLDLRSAQAQQAVAAEQLRLAEDELAQSRERFKAGGGGDIEGLDAPSKLIPARDRDIHARLAPPPARGTAAGAGGGAPTPPLRE